GSASRATPAKSSAAPSCSPEANVIYGDAYDDSLGDEVRVTVVATGLSRPAAGRGQPELQVIRTGTDNVAFQVPTLGGALASGVASGAAGQAKYDGMAVPSVWRTNRTMAAAKVDALSSGGMDDFEIPAFLRRQAD
ncbi:MAG: cell division protein FtsZ, partial [Pseudacidovorax sp.]|nr:cell division protein FtsZ [Pseudacidovorax sp.]